MDIYINDEHIIEKPWEEGCYINYRNVNNGDKKYSCPNCTYSTDSSKRFDNHLGKKVPCHPNYEPYLQKLVDKNHRKSKYDIKPFGLSYNNEPTLITVEDHKIYKDIDKRDFIYWDIPIDNNKLPRLNEAEKWVDINKYKTIWMIKIPFIQHKCYINPTICKYEGVDCIRLELV